MIDLFKKLENSEKKEEHPRSIEIFARKKGRALKRYGTKKPDEKFDFQKRIAWRDENEEI